MAEVTIYTTAICPFCIAAKRLFESLNINYSEVGLDRDPALRMRLAEENGGWRTVPMIFIGDRMIGGFSEAKSLHQEGRLLSLLNAPESRPSTA
jgi:glutaredoxin 3